MSRLTVGSIEGLAENSNVISVPTGHSLNVADAGGLQIGGSAVVSAGLVSISPTSIDNAGGSVSISSGLVTFTGVSAISLNGVFSSAFANYRLLFNRTNSGGSAAQYQDVWRLRASGVDDSSSNYHYYSSYYGTASGNVLLSAVSLWYLGDGYGSGDESAVTLDLYNPNKASTTFGHGLRNYRYNTNDKYGRAFGVEHSLSSVFDGITVTSGSGTFSGTFAAYGYRGS